MNLPAENGRVFTNPSFGWVGEEKMLSPPPLSSPIKGEDEIYLGFALAA